jgi:tetratricopeptide (TPR) repeat protein
VAGSVTAVKFYLARRAYQTALDEYGEDLEKKRPLRESIARRLERSIRLAPGDPDPHFLLGRIRGRSGKPEEARKHLAECLRVFPLNGRAHFYLGFAHHFLAKRKAAADRDGAYLNKVLLIIEKNAFPYRNLVKIIPDNPHGHWGAGHYLGHRRGSWEPALEELVKAGAALEDKSGFLFDRGLALLFTQAEPRPDFRRAITLSPDKNKTIRRLSYYYVAARRHAEGLAFWAELEEAYPHLPGPVVNRAEGDFNAIRERLQGPMHIMHKERAQELAKTRNPVDRKRVEEHYFTKGKAIWQDAYRGLERYLKEKLSMFEEDPDLWKLNGEMLKLQGRYDEAELSFRHAADAGGRPEFWKALIQFLIFREDYTKAWEAAIRAKGVHPEDRDIAILVERTRDLMLANRKEK